ncbi:hypothetical protein DEO72_LG2g3515 [Vigna unguiculata]|uniref:Uncharacterized protein n=1 Tax=Vigna unguiculata TaxID=3917 RepID=A0A4D6L3T5_VIGUN|nr:hypothetical protein DEO72_LG2g3515 [Vigna unguiculata]
MLLMGYRKKFASVLNEFWSIRAWTAPVEVEEEERDGSRGRKRNVDGSGDGGRRSADKKVGEGMKVDEEDASLCEGGERRMYWWEEEDGRR